MNFAEFNLAHLRARKLLLSRSACVFLLITHFILMPLHQVNAANESSPVYALLCSAGQLKQVRIDAEPIAANTEAELANTSSCPLCTLADSTQLILDEETELAHFDGVCINLFYASGLFTPLQSPSTRSIRAPPADPQFPKRLKV